MKFVKTKVYRYQLGNTDIIACEEAYLMKDEIYFENDFNKTFFKKKVGLQCHYFFEPDGIKCYPDNCNVKIHCDVKGYLPTPIMIIYAKLDENDIFNLKVITQRFWLAQPEFLKGTIVPAAMGFIGGIISSIIILYIKKISGIE